MSDPVDVPIRDESIRLGQFLKLANLVESGAEAKPLIVAGMVQVNGGTEPRRGRGRGGEAVGGGGEGAGQRRDGAAARPPAARGRRRRARRRERAGRDG